MAMMNPQPSQPSSEPQVSRIPEPPTRVITLPETAIAPRRRSFVGDITAGAFLGDFARDLRWPGAATQIVLSYVPLIGSMCAVRDLVADMRHHDRVGAVLNLLALAPVLGGFSKTLEVVRGMAHVGHAVHVTDRRRDDWANK